MATHSSTLAWKIPWMEEPGRLHTVRRVTKSQIRLSNQNIRASQVALMVKNLPANAGDLGSIPGLGRPSGEGNGNPLKYSCLENPMGGGAWLLTVQRAAETRLSDFTFFLSFNIPCHIIMLT